MSRVQRADAGPLPRVVLCAVLTLDGKLDTSQDLSPARFPWASWGVTDALLPTHFADSGNVVTQLRRFRRDSGVRRVCCPGDAASFRALFDAGVVTEIWLAVRPQVDGRRDAPTLSGPPGAEWFPTSLACRLVRMEMEDGECLLSYRMTNGG